jgi:hypothetical protein
MIECDFLQSEAILNALATGAYTGQKDELHLPSSGILPGPLLEEFGLAHARSQSMWRFLKNSKQTLDRLGIRVPESLKAQLRRIF